MAKSIVTENCEYIAKEYPFTAVYIEDVDGDGTHEVDQANELGFNETYTNFGEMLPGRVPLASRRTGFRGVENYLGPSVFGSAVADQFTYPVISADVCDLAGTPFMTQGAPLRLPMRLNAETINCSCETGQPYEVDPFANLTTSCPVGPTSDFGVLPTPVVGIRGVPGGSFVCSGSDSEIVQVSALVFHKHVWRWAKEMSFGSAASATTVSAGGGCTWPGNDWNLYLAYRNSASYTIENLSSIQGPVVQWEVNDVDGWILVHKFGTTCFGSLLAGPATWIVPEPMLGLWTGASEPFDLPDLDMAGNTFPSRPNLPLPTTGDQVFLGAPVNTRSNLNDGNSNEFFSWIAQRWLQPDQECVCP